MSEDEQIRARAKALIEFMDERGWSIDEGRDACLRVVATVALMDALDERLDS